MENQVFYQKVYALLQKALNRGEEHVSNITVNKVIKLYITIGSPKKEDIIKDLETIKPAKSVAILLDHITKGLRKGTRTDGQKLDFTGLID